MKLLELILCIYVANVSTQLISQQHTSPGFIQIQHSNRTHHSIPPTRASGEIRGSATRRKNTGFNNNNRRDDSKGQKDANVKGNQRTNQSPNIFTNVSQDLHGNNIKYIQRLKSSSELDKIIFYDDVNYNREPFTNKRKLEDNFTYSTGPSRDPSGTPYRGISMTSGQQHLNSFKGASIAHDNQPYNETAEGTLYNNTNEETTTVEFELDNRVAFGGDSCATGQVKVRGKCVKET